MIERATNMPDTWANGKRRSTGNAFAAAYLTQGIPDSHTPPAKPGVKPALRVLNAAGRPQATLATATLNNISIGPKKTVEQAAAAALRKSQFDRPAKVSKKVAA